MAWPTCAPVGWALKDGAKVQGWQKSDSGIVGLRGDKGGLGRIKEDMRRKLGCGEGVKRGMDTLIFEKIGVNRAIKKPRQAWRIAVALGNSILIYALAIPYACRTIPTNVFLECIEK